MASRTRVHQKKKRIVNPDTSTALAQPMLQSHPFDVQKLPVQESQQQPDLKTALQQAERYGHSLSKMQPAAVSDAPAVQRQMGNLKSSGCLRPTSKMLRAKLTVGEAGDVYEQEADAVAARVVDRINGGGEKTPEHQPEPEQSQPTQQRKKKKTLQPLGLNIQHYMQRESRDVQESQPDTEQSIEQKRGGGQSLSDQIRKPMEQEFGADFSGVKVHMDAQSDWLNRSIQARAFTTGQDVFFRQGEYNPGSREGQELLAHELTHVAQQNGGAVQAKLEIVQRVANNIVQRVFNPNKPDTYDHDGGHSYADHGSHTKEIEHETRLTTGLTPSGRNSMPPDGKSSKFASDAMHSAAMTIAINDLNANKKNRAGGWKRGYTNHYTLAGVGETYELDTSGSKLKPATTPCNRFYVAWSNDGTGDDFKLITMYPKP